MKWLWQRKDEELDAEIQHHLDEAIRERMARGESVEQARLNARHEFGNVGLVKEDTRAMWSWAAFERLMQDLRFGGRLMRKNSGYTLVAIFTLALGATRRDVLRLVFRQRLKLAAIGMVLGLVISIAASRLLAAALYGISPTDPLTLAVITFILLATALLACWIPARRATKVDPLIALRHD